MLSISTCWNSARHTDGEAMIDELLEFGFDAVELGLGIRVSLLPGIERAFDAGRVRFSSLHNFCPLPVEITQAAPDCLQFSSYREAERERAVRQTCKTIDLAARLGAPLVVLHGGRVAMADATARLLTLASEGGHLSPEYARLKFEAVHRREAIAPKFLARVRDCLARVVEHAAGKGVKLGLEGRHSYEEIPSEREFPALLEGFDPTVIGTWHDFGHLQVKHNLGFVDHAAALAAAAPRLLGAHLHDTAWPGRDHLPPFQGGIDYEKLVPLLPKNCLLVWEMSTRNQAQEIAQSLRRWRDRFGG